MSRKRIHSLIQRSFVPRNIDYNNVPPSDLKSRICEVQKCDGVENCPLDPEKDAGQDVAWDERNCIPYDNVTFQPPPEPKPPTTTPLGEFANRTVQLVTRSVAYLAAGRMMWNLQHMHIVQ